MSRKRVLLVHPDAPVRDFLSEKLEAGGVEVFTAETGVAAIAAFEDHAPDLIVMDLVLAPVTAGPDVVRGIRAISMQVPILGLAGAVPQVAQAATQAGITKVLPPSANPVYQVLNAMRQVLGASGTPPPLATETSGAAALLEQVPELVNLIRQELRILSKVPGTAAALERVLQPTHALSQRIALAGFTAVQPLTLGLETLLYDLRQTPAGLNASTLRTIGQATDAISTLLEPANFTSLADPTGARVCTIDDDSGAREVIMATLRMAGLKPEGAATPEAGLALLQEQKFDLVFLDVGMPGMTGFELCEKVRAIPHHQTTPIVFITGLATLQNRAQGILSGGNDFVGKPFNLPELALKALLWIVKKQLETPK